MTRAVVRNLKKGLRGNPSNAHARSDLAAMQQSALALLKRSIKFGHGRLAIQRLATAVRVGANIPPEDLAYCINAMARARKAKERTSPHPHRANSSPFGSARS